MPYVPTASNDIAFPEFKLLTLRLIGLDLKESSQLSGRPETHWYYASKFELLAANVQARNVRRVLDIGSGSGVFARLLLDRTDCQDVICVDPAYERDYDEKVNGKTIRFRKKTCGEDVDLVLVMDVLEHVEDDVALLYDIKTTAKKGTCIFITVPAFNCLWSAHDVFLEHRRRYTARALVRAITDAGLTLDRARYFFAAILPAAALLRLLPVRRDPEKGSDLRPVPSAIGWLLVTILRLERVLVFPYNRLAGLTVVATATVG